MSDPGLSYREKSDVDNVRATRDPIEFIKNLILSNNVATEKDLKAINKKIKNDIDDIVEKVKAEPFPDPNEMFEDIHAPGETHFIRNVEYKDSVWVNK